TRQLTRAPRGQARQIGERVAALARGPEGAAARALRLWRGKSGHVEGQGPALVVGEVAEAHHRGTLDAQWDRAEEAVGAALAHALGVVEVAGAGIEALARRPVAVAGGAVAKSAARGEERGATLEIGHALGRDVDVVRADEGPAQFAGEARHLGF